MCVLTYLITLGKGAQFAKHSHDDLAQAPTQIHEVRATHAHSLKEETGAHRCNRLAGGPGVWGSSP